MTRDEARAKWIAALRSGKHEQGFGSFEKRGRLCALMVAAREIGFYIGRSASVSRNTIQFFSVDADLCMRWNDFQFLTFPEIADRLEAGEAWV